jgi:hypothetical protein
MLHPIAKEICCHFWTCIPPSGIQFNGSLIFLLNWISIQQYKITIPLKGIHCDTPSSSLMDSTKSPKVKIMEGEGVGARSLAHNTLGVKGCGGALGWD